MNNPPKHPTSFVDVALLWESAKRKRARRVRLETAEAFAADIGQNRQRVYKWAERNFIPPDYWPAIIAAAKQRFGIVLTLDELQAMGVAALKERQSRKDDAA